MNSVLSWSVKGIDPKVREAAKLAARRQGKTLGQWLNSTIMDYADEGPDRPEDHMVPHRGAGQALGDPMTERVSFLEQQLMTLTRHQSDTAVPQQYGSASEPTAAPLQNLLDRLDRSEQDTVRTFQAVQGRLEQLAVELRDSKKDLAKVGSMPAAGYKAFEQALNDVVDHIENTDKLNRDTLGDLREKLDDLSSKVADGSKSAEYANRKILGDVEERLTSLAHRVDQLGEIDPKEVQHDIEGRLSKLTEHVEQIGKAAPADLQDTIDEQLSELSHRLDVAERLTSQSQSDLHQSLESRLDFLAERIETITSTSSETAAQAADAAIQTTQATMLELEKQQQLLAEQLASVSAQSSGPSHDEVRDLETKVTQLAQQVDAAADAAAAPDPGTETAIAQLTNQVGSIQNDVQQIKVEAASEHDVQSIKTMLDTLSTTVEQQFAEVSPDGAFANLEARLADVTRRLDEQIQAPTPNPQIEILERRIHEIDARLASAQGDGQMGAEGEGMIQALREQVEGVSSRLTEAEKSHGGIQAIEKSIAQLFESAEQSRAFATEVAEKAASEMAERLRPEIGTSDAPSDSSATLKALEDGLQGLKDSAEAADQRTQETLEAVHETLEKVITRLSALEETEPQHAMQDPDDADQQPMQDLGADTIHGLDSDAIQDALAELRLPPIPPAGAPDNLQAPDPEGDGDAPSQADADETAAADEAPEQPDTGGLEVPRAGPQGPQDIAAEPAPDGATVTRRDDFIAAARLAAQSSPATSEEEESGSRFKGLRRGRRGKREGAASSKRRPLLLAAIALLLIGAVSAYHMVGGELSAPSPERTATPPETLNIPTLDVTPKPQKATPELETLDPAPSEVTRPPASQDQSLNSNLNGPTETLSLPLDGTPVSPGAQSPAKTSSAHKSDLEPIALTTGSITPNREAQADPVVDPLLFDMPPARSGLQARSTATTDPITTQSIDRNITPAESAQPVAKAPSPKASDLPPKEVGPMGLRVAAASGDPVAQFIVATEYAEGGKLKQDFRKAASWYQKAAARGLAPAQYRIATFYEKGRGVPKDIAAARIWYERAAEKGNRKAMHNLAVIYADSTRGTPEFTKAAIWFRNAAELGLKDSQYNLGILHERGLGVANDLTQAYKWFALAAGQGDADAATRKVALEGRLPAEQLIKAKLEVQNWAPQDADRRANVVTPPANGWAKKGSEDDFALFSSNERVAEAQQLLNRLGYVVGTPDGIVGAKTRQAIRRFQKAKGMPETGQVTSGLLQSLREVTSG